MSLYDMMMSLYGMSYLKRGAVLCLFEFDSRVSFVYILGIFWAEFWQRWRGTASCFPATSGWSRSEKYKNVVKGLFRAFLRLSFLRTWRCFS